MLPDQIGPEKGVVHLATAAVLNAVWDLWAKQEGKVPPRRSALRLGKDTVVVEDEHLL